MVVMVMTMHFCYNEGGDGYNDGRDGYIDNEGDKKCKLL